MLQPGAPNAVESARSGTFQQYRGRSSSTVEAAAAAETPAVDCRHRCNACPHHQCHSRSPYRFRLRHHRRHPRLKTTAPSRRPAPGGAQLARSPPPPPSISKAHSRHSLHPRRHHRPCHHLGRNIRRCRALRRVGGPFCPLTPTVKNGHVTAISRAQCGVRTSSLVHWSYNNIVTLRSVADWS